AELLPEDTPANLTLSLLRPDGKTLATALRSAGGSRLADIVLPSDGFYALAVQAERPVSLGYQLRLIRLQPAASYQGALALESPSESALRPEQTLHEWLLRPERDERLALSLSAARGVQGVRVLVVTAEGALVAEGSLRDGAIGLDFQAQAGAHYAVLVQNVDGVQGRYQLAVRPSRPLAN
ncbi:MAG: hypothetical protein ACK4P1_06565, partial [Aggregatilineales bacterium]